MTAFVTNASAFGGILSACIEKRVHVQSNRVARGMLAQRRGLQACQAVQWEWVVPWLGGAGVLASACPRRRC